MAAKTRFIYAVAVIVCTYVYNVHGLEDSYYMEDYCRGSGTQLFVGNNGVKLYSQRGRTYQNNIDCALTFYTSVGQVLILASQRINFGSISDCITLTDGPHTALPSVTHCKDDRLGYITTQRYLTIQMTTDSSFAFSGFLLNVTTYNNTNADTYYMENYCKWNYNQLRVGENGVNLYSQRGTTYQDNLDCTLTFYTDIKQVIILRSHEMDLQSNTDCIKLSDGEYATADPFLHCSNESLLFMTSQRYLTIQMTTSSSTNFAGFHLGLASTNNGADTYYMEDYCSWTDQVHVGLDDEVKLYSQRALRYQANLNCTLTFYTDVGQIIVLRSRMIDLGYRSDCIKLIDGHFTSQPSVTHCSDLPLTYITSQSNLTIRMTTDSSQDYQSGFLLNVTAYDNTDPFLEIPCFSGFGQYQCRDGRGCYSDYDKCNSYPSCGDKTDDLNCDHCDDDSFLCLSSRRCIPAYIICNDQDDCPNGEDEDLPECYPTIWMQWTGGQIAGLGIGYLIFLVIVIAIVVVVNKKCKKLEGKLPLL